ncbi:hypothetical protein L1887_24688 [Cichorium endivia]|nr:hypothetical protein L1887_24688 [Cichorium endivia]
MDMQQKLVKVGSLQKKFRRLILDLNGHSSLLYPTLYKFRRLKFQKEKKKPIRHILQPDIDQTDCRHDNFPLHNLYLPIL